MTSDAIERAQALLAVADLGVDTKLEHRLANALAAVLTDLTEALPSADACKRLQEICGDNNTLTLGERVNQLVAAYDAECEMDEAREVLRGRTAELK